MADYMNLNYTLTLAQGCLREADPEVMARLSGSAFYPETSEISVPYFNTNLRVKYPQGTVEGEEGPPPIVEQILVLHYLVRADATPVKGSWVAFRNLPGGNIYTEPFRKRAIQPLINLFGQDPEQLKIAASKIGGKPADFGHTGAMFSVFPYIRIALVIWPGDNEVPASGTILFDENTPRYLPTEDCVHTAVVLIGKLKQILQHSID